jgi:hypothetical protein
MRPGISFTLSGDDRSRLEAIVRGRNNPRRSMPGEPTSSFSPLTVTARSTPCSVAACSATATRSSSCFLNAIEATVPTGKLVHVILDNYAAHKQSKVLAWLSRHSRFTSTSRRPHALGSTAVETFFATLTKRRLSEASSAPSSISKLLSIDTSMRPAVTPSPSF